MTTDFKQVLQEFGPLISRVAKTYEANHALSQELTQEMCLAIWQALQKFRGESSVKTFVLKVAHNKGVNHVAYYARIPRQGSLEDEQVTSLASLQDVERQSAHHKQIEQLLDAVRQLPIQSRQVVTMSMEGMSYQDIAEVCGISVSNVGVLLNRAKQKLSERVQDV